MVWRRERGGGEMVRMRVIAREREVGRQVHRQEQERNKQDDRMAPTSAPDAPTGMRLARVIANFAFLSVTERFLLFGLPPAAAAAAAVVVVVGAGAMVLPL